MTIAKFLDISRFSEWMVTLKIRLPWPYEPLSDDDHNENDKEQNKNAKNLYHEPAIWRHRLEIFDKFGVSCSNADVRIVNVCINPKFHTNIYIHRES